MCRDARGRDPGHGVAIRAPFAQIALADLAGASPAMGKERAPCSGSRTAGFHVRVTGSYPDPPAKTRDEGWAHRGCSCLAGPSFSRGEDRGGQAHGQRGQYLGQRVGSTAEPISATPGNPHRKRARTCGRGARGGPRSVCIHVVPGAGLRRPPELSERHRRLMGGDGASRVQAVSAVVPSHSREATLTTSRAMYTQCMREWGSSSPARIRSERRVRAGRGR